MPPVPDDIATVEATYDLESASLPWLQQVVSAAGCMQRLGDIVLALEYDTNGPFPNWLRTVTSWGDGGAAGETMRGLFANPEVSIVRGLFDLCGPVSEVPPAVLGSGFLSLHGPHPVDFTAFLRQYGCADVALVNATDGGGRGVFFCIRQPAQSALSRATQRRLQRIAGHIAAAVRLRRRVGVSPAAVFSVDGKALDAGQSTEAALPSLREAVRRMDRARGPLRRKAPDEALDAWAALVEGRWSLVDSFESDGKRFVLALENQPVLEDPRRLTQSERAVSQLVAHGHSNKLAAYELGLTTGAIGAYLSSAMRKLGCASRVELARHLLDLNRARVARLAFGDGTLIVAAAEPLRFHDPRLTPAEREVLEAVGAGASNGEIAAARGSAVRTVANQIAVAYRKLGVTSRLELVRWANDWVNQAAARD